MTDKVKHMIRGAPQLALQRGEPRLREALDPYLAAVDQPRERLVQLRPLGFDIEADMVVGARNHHQDLEWGIDGQRPDALGEIE